MSDRLNFTFQLASFLVAVAALVVAVATAPHSVKRAKGWALSVLLMVTGRACNGTIRIWRKHRTVISTAGATGLFLGVITPIVFSSNEDPASPSIDYSRPVLIQTANSGLQLTVEANHAPLEAEALVVNPQQSSADTWEIASPHPQNGDFRQMRARGKLLMCLETEDQTQGSSTWVRQYYCHSGKIHYWRFERADDTHYRIINMNSGRCISTTGDDPQPGMSVVHLPCGESGLSQLWSIYPATPSPTPSAEPVLRQLPGDGDLACDAPPSTPSAANWSETERTYIRSESPRGEFSIGYTAAAQLVRANRHNPDGREETFYWARAHTMMDPGEWSMTLQWTAIDGPGGWHSCSTTLTRAGVPFESVTIPREIKGTVTKFRACLTYKPKLGTGIVQCTKDRY